MLYGRWSSSVRVREPEQWDGELWSVLWQREQRADERELEHRFPAFQICHKKDLHQIIPAAAKIDSKAAGLVGERRPGSGKEGRLCVGTAKRLTYAMIERCSLGYGTA